MYTSFQKFVVGKIYKKRVEHKHKSIMSVNIYLIKQVIVKYSSLK